MIKTKRDAIRKSENRTYNSNNGNDAHQCSNNCSLDDLDRHTTIEDTYLTTGQICDTNEISTDHYELDAYLEPTQYEEICDTNIGGDLVEDIEYEQLSSTFNRIDMIRGPYQDIRT